MVTKAILEAILKENYTNYIADVRAKERFWHDSFMSEGKKWDADGKWVIQPINPNRNSSVGAYREGQPMRPAGNQTPIKQIIDVRYNILRISLTKAVMDASLNSIGSFERAIEFEMNQGIPDFHEEEDWQIGIDNGTGSVGVIKAGDTTTKTHTVQYAGASAGAVLGQWGTKYMKVGAGYLIGTASDIAATQAAGTLQGSCVYGVVESITNLKTVVFTAEITTVTGDIIVPAYVGYNVMTGASGYQCTYGINWQGVHAAAVQSGTYQNINLSANTGLRMHILTNPDGAGTGRNLTASLLTQGIIKVKNSGGRITRLVMAEEMIDAYLDMMRNDKRFLGPSANDPGFDLENLKFNKTVKVETARNFPPNEIMGIDDTAWTRYPLGTPKWVDPDGQVIRLVPNTLNSEAVYAAAGNVGCQAPHHNFLLKDLNMGSILEIV